LSVIPAVAPNVRAAPPHPPRSAPTRCKPGSVSAAIAEYFGSHAFRSLTGGTPAKRRAILEHFREQYGDKNLASLPKEFVVALLDQMPPHAGRNWLNTFRHLIRCASNASWCALTRPGASG